MGIYTLRCPISCFWLKQRFRYMILCCKSLTYNTHDSLAETLFEPIIFIVNFGIRWLGKVFVVAVVCLVTSVVLIFYLYILPIVLEVNSSLYAYLHLSYGHYLLIMISFHYYKAVTICPGKPPSAIHGSPVTSVCKKCLLPKPPRTHHCNVCNLCRLKMDHHCPWVNNCIGHFNQRYFISFCVFMCLGTIYVSCSSYSVFKDCFLLIEKLEFAKESVLNFLGQGTVSEKIIKTARFFPNDLCFGKSRSFSNSVVYLWILCSSVTFALGYLTIWHILLISRGETSIERLIYEKERRRMRKLKKRFSNPHNFGVLENWKLLLGCYTARSIFFKLILPSSHLPAGDGVTWNTYDRNGFVA